MVTHGVEERIELGSKTKDHRRVKQHDHRLMHLYQISMVITEDTTPFQMHINIFKMMVREKVVIFVK